ncbi:hypothetical protein AUJ83_00450 [Candidatus Woesearchaeota archaeon CG1_02_33_12]|nr:MAG: hypothetical protein AUJ83_00450 [Candidatus Woesearchaeota archaeon CG1_02_33_12]
MDKEEKNDEVTIDFSKVKGFFKKKKENKEDTMHEKTEPEETEIKEKQDKRIEVGESKEIEDKKPEETKEDIKKNDEVTIDFGKIKGFFKKKKGTKDEATDEETINIGGIFESFNKNRKVLVPLIIILICMSFSIYFRTQPAYLPVTDDWARSSIYNQYKSQISSQINQQNPFLPEANKAEIVETEFNNLLKTQKAEIEANIVQLSNYFKSRLQDESGQTYLLAIDPYFWYRNARNYLEHGFAADIEIDGNYYSTHRLAPFMEEDIIKTNTNEGEIVKTSNRFGGWWGKKFENLNVLIEVWLYKIVHLFNENISLMAVCFYVPVIISSLAVIPAFFIAKRVSGNVGGFFAALMVAIHPFFISRTAGGFADTDPYNVFFPLLIAWLFLEAFEAKDNLKRIVLASLSGLCIGLFSFAWSGWSFIFNFLIGTAGIYILYQIFIHRKEFKKSVLGILRYKPIKNTLAILVTFLLSSGIFVTLFMGLNVFTSAFTEYIRFAGMKDVAVTTLWYNVYTTVAELNPLSWTQIVQQIGGSFLLFIACIGVLLTLTKKDSQGKIDIKYAVLIMMWFFATAYASTKGVRFVLIMVPAFSLGFGIALGVIYNFATRWITNEMQLNKIMSCFVVFILLSLLIINPMKTAQATAKNEIPSMNDAWYDALTMIKENSSEDAIINSWWDFGHWFKAIADRGVTLDGGGQDQPQAHWLGRLMLTSDEDESMGIIRMLDCGKHYGFKAIDNLTNDTIKTMDILYEIIPLSKSEAEKALLKHGFSDENISKILKYTHCEPPEDYFITSADMVNKAGVWGHFGSWDFRRAAMYQSVKKIKNVSKGTQILMDKFNLSEENADNIYYEIQTTDADQWVSGWPGYATGLSACKKIDNETIQCDHIFSGNQLIRFNINLTTMNAEMPAQDGILHPSSIVYPTEDGIHEKKYIDNAIPYSIALIPEGDSFKSILMAPELASSIFTKLFFYQGYGLKHFELFHQVTDVTGADIYVWKINWEGKGIDETEKLE